MAFYPFSTMTINIIATFSAFHFSTHGFAWQYSFKFFFLKIKWTFFEKWKILCSPQNSLFIFFKTFLIRLYVFPHLVSLGILWRIYTIAIHRKLHFTVDIIYRIFFICFHLYNQTVANMRSWEQKRYKFFFFAKTE